MGMSIGTTNANPLSTLMQTLSQGYYEEPIPDPAYPGGYELDETGFRRKLRRVSIASQWNAAFAQSALAQQQAHQQIGQLGQQAYQGMFQGIGQSAYQQALGQQALGQQAVSTGGIGTATPYLQPYPYPLSYTGQPSGTPPVTVIVDDPHKGRTRGRISKAIKARLSR